MKIQLTRKGKYYLDRCIHVPLYFNYQITKSLYSDRAKQLRRASKRFTSSLAMHGDIAISAVPHLAEVHDVKTYQSPLLGDIAQRDNLGLNDDRGFLPDQAFTDNNKFVIAGQSYGSIQDIAKELKFLRAGPRKEIIFDPKDVKAAIVTCGGLCPGLNVVIREIFMTLYYNYGVKEVYGVRWGYRGFHDAKNIIQLQPKDVRNLHHQGGSWLGSARGGFDEKVIIDA